MIGPAPGPRPRRAFTLVEVIVVTAVIALVLGLTLPALSGAGAAGRRAACLSNLRQMAVAAQQYATVYDAWPAAVRYERREGVLVQVAWDWATTPGGELVGPGPLWSFLDDPGRTMQCPAYLGTTNFGGDPHTGYNYNTTYVGGEARFPGVGWPAVRRGVPPHACSRGSSCALFGDGGRAGGTNKFMRAPLGSEPSITLDEIYSGGQAFRHLGATNVAHLDGHVASANDPRPGERATEPLLRGHLGYPRNGFLSDDDRAYDPR